MPKTNKRIRTLRENTHAVSNPTAWQDVAAPQTSNGQGDPPQMLVIEKLPNASACKNLLERVVREFLPIIQRRGYKVVSVSEMCCCGDGIKAKSRRKRNTRMGNNVLGYNQTFLYNGRKTHEIHLRMRHIRSHTFFDYEDVAGTMAHELGHCERGPHDKLFFEIVEGILDEHAKLLASRLTSMGGLQPMMPFSGSGQRLGDVTSQSVGGRMFDGAGYPGAGNRLGGSTDGKEKSRLVTGHRLGGDCCFPQFMRPSEAALVAAEARKKRLLILKSRQCCIPCVIDLTGDGEEEKNNELVSISQGNDQPARNETDQKFIVDLTGLDESPGAAKMPVTRPSFWNCHQCTFRNNAKATNCEMCASERAMK